MRAALLQLDPLAITSVDLSHNGQLHRACATGRWPAPVHHVTWQESAENTRQYVSYSHLNDSIPIVFLGSLASTSVIRMDLMAEGTLASGWLRCYS